MQIRSFIHFLIYTLFPVVCSIRGFYLYETVSWQAFRAYAYDLGTLSWIIFLVLVFLPPTLRLVHPVPLLGRGLRLLARYERELSALFTWLAFFHILFIIISLRQPGLAFASITDLRSPWSWGVFAGITGLIMGATTNDFSKHLLKTFWHYTRPLFLVTFFLSCVHVALIKGQWTYLVIMISGYMALRLIGYLPPFKSSS